MSHIENGQRTFLKDRVIYAYKERPFLGLSESAVVLSDEGLLIGYAGDQAKTDLVKADTATDGFGNTLEIPTDFRVHGIQHLDNAGISKEVQARMFNNFMALPKEQRDGYVAQYDTIDKNDPLALENFINAMVGLFNHT